MNKVGPFEAVTDDYVRPDGYRILVSGAYNAMGLIGSEMNGIAVLDEQAKVVVADCIGRQSSGWYGTGGPGPKLAALFEELKFASPEVFSARVNDLGSDRLRTPVIDRTDALVEEMIATIGAAGANAGLDALNDALHEAADRAGIPEGDSRDEWRLARLEDLGLGDHSGSHDDEMLARALVAMAVQTQDIESAETFLRP